MCICTDLPVGPRALESFPAPWSYAWRYIRRLPHCRLVKDTSSWNNKKEMAEAEQASCDQLAASLAELDEEEMAARVQRATQERDAAQEAHDRWIPWWNMG